MLKIGYAMEVNGLHDAQCLCPENRTKWFDDFLENMTNVQVAAIITKF